MLFFFDIFIFMLLFMLLKSRNYMYVLLHFFFFIIFLSINMLLIGVEFLSFMLLLIYAGAVLILFLFVVMLFDGDILYNNKQNFSKFVLIFIFLQGLVWFFFFNYSDRYDVDLYIFTPILCDYMGYYNIVMLPFDADFNFSVDNFIIEYTKADNFFISSFVGFDAYVQLEQPGFCTKFIQHDDFSLFHEVSVYLFNCCAVEFCLMGLLLFVCLVSVGMLLRVGARIKFSNVS